MTKSVRWGLAKDDVTPQDIFRLSNMGPDERAIVAKYCIQDCNLVHHLMNKIDVITGFVEMANICSVPMDFLVLRGQGIKLTSFIAKKCREKETLMPVVEKVISGDPRPGGYRPGNSQSGDSRPGGSRSGDSRSGGYRPGNSQSGDSRPGGYRSGADGAVLCA